MNVDAIVQFAAALGIGILLYFVLLRPLARETCLFDNPDCIRLFKRQMGDAFLVDIPNTGETLWYNGKDLVAYNIPSGDVCNVGEPGYAWMEGERGFFCVKPLASVRQIFSHQPLIPWSKKLAKGERSATKIATQLGARVPI